MLNFQLFSHPRKTLLYEEADKWNHIEIEIRNLLSNTRVSLFCFSSHLPTLIRLKEERKKKRFFNWKNFRRQVHEAENEQFFYSTFNHNIKEAIRPQRFFDPFPFHFSKQNMKMKFHLGNVCN